MAGRISQSLVEVLLTTAPSAVVSQSLVEVLVSTAVVARLSQSLVEVLIESPTPTTPSGGGGTVGTGTNPSTSTLGTNLPLLFAVITLGSGTQYAYAETPLNDATTWYAGRKAPRILRCSRVRRALSDDTGAYQLQSWTLELADTDRVLRGLQATGTLLGAKVELYLVSDTVRRAEGVPYRIVAGVIGAHRALSGFRYELTVEDKFGNLLANTLREKMIGRTLTIDADSAPGLLFQFDGTVAPYIYGTLSDETETSPQGTVPTTYVGPVDLSALGGVGTVDVYLVCGHACAEILGVYYNNPNTAEQRYKVPDSAYNDVIWAPHKTGWASKTGMAGQYFDYNGLRYTVILLKQDIPYAATDPSGNPVTVNIAEYARNGNVSITVNLQGIEATGDGSGLVIDDIDLIWQHVLCNFVFSDTETGGVGGWAAVPDFEGYSVLDTSTVTAAKAVATARLAAGYKAGIVLGADNRQISAFDALQQLCFSGDVDMGINRHGQLILSRESTSASAVATFDARADILDDGFDTLLQSDTYYNNVRYRYAYRYAASTAPRANTYQGWALPERLTAPYQQWLSGVITSADSGAVTAVQQTITVDLEFHALRTLAVADNVVLYKRNRAIGPAASLDGSRLVTIRTGLQGLQQSGVEIELGTVIAITHPEGLTSSGWTAQKVRVLAMDVDPMTFSVTLECRVLS